MQRADRDAMQQAQAPHDCYDLFTTLQHWQDLPDENKRCAQEHWFSRWKSFLNDHGVFSPGELTFVRVKKRTVSPGGTPCLEFELASTVGFSTGMWALVSKDNRVFGYQCLNGECWTKCRHVASDFIFESNEKAVHGTNLDEYVHA